jgi:hypothetical protein
MSPLSRTLAATLSLAAGVASQNVNSVLTPADCNNLVSNGNFEQDGHSGGRG